MILTFEEFKDLVGYTYKELDIKLSTPKCEEHMMVIDLNTKEDLPKIFKKIKELSFKEGFNSKEEITYELKEFE